MIKCEFEVSKEMMQFIRRNKNQIYETFINYDALNFRMSKSFDDEQIMKFKIENKEFFLMDYQNKIVNMVLNGVIKENDKLKFQVRENGNEYLKGLDENAKIYEVYLSIYRKNEFKIEIMLLSNVFWKNPFALNW